jgi:Tol biopolymer transport system component/tRNA A-37 threonylcarbamoyl transferase component Bud32
MPLSAGTRLGPYEILARIGAGGMGEVYKATDTRLHRDVAIKVSAEHFSERFEREAKAIASLNHPNICTLYDVGPDYLVMELLDGPTLAERLKQAPIAMDEALEIAGQIAEALEAAHEKGITHRDLKPGNIKIKPDGTVKVLDFGLAKLVSKTPGGAPAMNAENSLTLTMGQTEAGMILGTAAYMSPEQAKGKPVDPRSDIYAFGLILYEMVTEKRLHSGETTTEVLASVIKEEPRWERVPPQVRKLLRRCLEKDPQKRLKHIGDVMALLDEAPAIGAAPFAAPPRSRISWGAWSAAGLAILAAAVVSAIHFREKPPAAPESVRFEIGQPANIQFTDVAVISPDGRKLAFVASSSGGLRQVWIRSLDAVEMHALPGTENVRGYPFWSPDSRYLVFSAQGKLQKILASGGPALTLCSDPDNNVLGGFWTRDNKIVYGGQIAPNGLSQVDAAGGAPSAVTSLRPGDVAHGFPTLLPDGRHFLYGVRTDAGGGIYLGSLDAKPNEQASKKLLPEPSIVAYVPSSDPNASATGYVLFVREGTLMAQPFDDRRLDVAGAAVPIAEGVAFFFSALPTGALVFRAGAASPSAQLAWFDRKGNSLGVAGDPSEFAENSPVSLSPDGKRAAFARTDPRDGNTDIWLYEFARSVSSRFTFDPGEDVNPVWSPDGKTIVFAGHRGGAWGIYRRGSNLVGGEELLYKSPDVIPRPSSWSGDGRSLLFTAQFARSSIWMLAIQAQAHSGTLDAKPQALSPSEFSEEGARLSPDGRYFAYVSNSSGKAEVYVRPFEGSSSGAKPAGGTSMVSKNGGSAVRWQSDGKEIFYTRPGGDLLSVDVSTTPVFRAGVPNLMFKAPASSNWDVTADGQRFLFVVPAGQNSASPYTVVLNWQAVLKR